MGEAPASTVPDSPKGVIRFSISCKSLPTCASLVDVTTAFFADNCYAGHALDMKSASYDELDPQGKKSMRNKFATVKRAVRMVLLHADSYPSKPKNPSHHKDLIRGIATLAEKRLRKHEALGFKDKETVSVCKLEKQLGEVPAAVKEELEKKPLPVDTPDDMCKFFSSN